MFGYDLDSVQALNYQMTWLQTASVSAFISLVLSSQTFLVALSRNNPLPSCATYTGYPFCHQSHDLFEVLGKKRHISI